MVRTFCPQITTRHTRHPRGCYSFSKSIFDYYAATLCTSYIHPGSVCVCVSFINTAELSWVVAGSEKLKIVVSKKNYKIVFFFFYFFFRDLSFFSRSGLWSRFHLVHRLYNLLNTTNKATRTHKKRRPAHSDVYTRSRGRELVRHVGIIAREKLWKKKEIFLFLFKKKGINEKKTRRVWSTVWRRKKIE